MELLALFNPNNFFLAPRFNQEKNELESLFNGENPVSMRALYLFKIAAVNFLLTTRAARAAPVNSHLQGTEEFNLVTMYQINAGIC